MPVQFAKISLSLYISLFGNDVHRRKLVEIYVSFFQDFPWFRCNNIYYAFSEEPDKEKLPNSKSFVYSIDLSIILAIFF